MGETSKGGDGVIIVPSIIQREGSQETVFNKNRTSIGKTIHYSQLIINTLDYNSRYAIHLTQGIRRRSASVRLVPTNRIFSTISSASPKKYIYIF